MARGQGVLLTVVMASLLAGPGHAQPAPAAPKPLPESAKPALADPAKSAAAQAERLALQSDLAWVGDYNGAINGEPGDRFTAALKTFQKRADGKPTGTLSAGERALLASEARAAREHAGWTLIQNDPSGAHLGIPAAYAPKRSATATGSKWSSAQGQVQIETWRLAEAGLTMAMVAERETAADKNRRVGYRVVKPDMVVISGLQGLKKFYLRAQLRNGEARGLTILYDQATEGTMEPAVIAMSSAFVAFPDGAAAMSVAAVRRPVEYATGVVVTADGLIVTDRSAMADCKTIAVPSFGYAARVADDEARSLTLLRLYGASGLKPAGVGHGHAVKGDLAVTGIADPALQQGRDAVTRLAVRLAAGDGAARLEPVPALGFAGAPAFDGERNFAGLVQLRPLPGGTTAQIVPANAVRAFLAANRVTLTASVADPKESVVRLVCVRP